MPVPGFPDGVGKPIRIQVGSTTIFPCGPISALGLPWVFSSQGTTVGRVLVEIDASKSAQLVNDRLGYVAISRARDEAVVFTNDADRLEKSLDRSLSKENAVDGLGMTREVTAGKGIESAVAAKVEQAAEAELAKASLERTIIQVGIALL